MQKERKMFSLTTHEGDTKEEIQIMPNNIKDGFIIHDLTKLFEGTEFNAFKDKVIKAVCVNAGEQSRKWYDEIGKVIVSYEGKGCAWIKYNDNELIVSNSVYYKSNVVENNYILNIMYLFRHYHFVY